MAGVNFYEIIKRFIINHNKDISHCNVGTTEVILTALETLFQNSKQFFFFQNTGFPSKKSRQSTQPNPNSLTKALLNCQPVVTVDWFHHVSCSAEPHTATPWTDLWARSRHITFYHWSTIPIQYSHKKHHKILNSLWVTHSMYHQNLQWST